MLTTTNISCGVRQLSQLFKLPKDLILEVKQHQNPCPFVIFSNHTRNKHAERLIQYIYQNKLGTVQESVTIYNPNSGNRIKVYLWKVNLTALQKFS